MQSSSTNPYSSFLHMNGALYMEAQNPLCIQFPPSANFGPFALLACPPAHELLAQKFCRPAT